MKHETTSVIHWPCQFNSQQLIHYDSQHDCVHSRGMEGRTTLSSDLNEISAGHLKCIRIIGTKSDQILQTRAYQSSTWLLHKNIIQNTFWSPRLSIWFLSFSIDFKISRNSSSPLNIFRLCIPLTADWSELSIFIAVAADHTVETSSKHYRLQCMFINSNLNATFN